MARAEVRYTGGTNRHTRTGNSYRVNTYVDGNTIRKVNTVPEREVQKKQSKSASDEYELCTVSYGCGSGVSDGMYQLSETAVAEHDLSEVSHSAGDEIE